MPTDVEIVTPEKLLLSRSVAMVVIPGAEGEIGVLAGHAPMIVLLRGGTVRLYDNGVVTDRLFVDGGFAEITPDRCTLLVTEVIPVEELSRAEAERRLADARIAYEAAEKIEGVATDSALTRMQSARAMLEAAPPG